MADNNALGFTPSGPPPTSGGSSGSSLGGFGKNYVPPIGAYGPISSYGPAGMAGPGGPGHAPTVSSGPTGSQTTLFGTAPQDTPYKTGAEWSVPLSDPSSIPTLKLEMYQAGLLTAKTLGNPAVWDASAASAYAKVLGFANAYGLNATDALSYFVANPVGGTSGSGTTSAQQLGAGVGGLGFNYFFPEYNPAAIQTGFAQQSQAMTGQEQGPMEPAFQRAFQSAEAQAAAGKDIAKSGPVGAGTNLKTIGAQNLGSGQYEQKPSPTDFAYSYLLQHDPQDVAAYGVATRMNDFLSMLGVK